METVLGCFILLVVAGMLVPFILVFTHARKIRTLETTIQQLSARLASLESGAPRPAVTPVAPAPAPAGVAEAAPASASDFVPPPAPVPAKAAVPPMAIPPPLPQSPFAEAVAETRASATPAGLPPLPRVTPPPPAPPRPAIDWESFLGVKLFAWIGGFVLFLGVVFLLKYAFDNNWITPTMRVVGGVVTGAALVALGWFTSQRNYRIPGQSLCATGILVLYASVFSAHVFYQLISLGVAFLILSFITIAAFLLAVRMDAPVIVVLGLIGGFMTPLLLKTGNRPLPTFGYIELINAGVAAVALRKRWDYLFLLAAIATFLLEMLWLPFGDTWRMRDGFLVFLSLQGQFLIFAWLRQRLQPNERWSTPSALVVAGASLIFAFAVLDVRALALRPGFFFGFLFLADIGLLALALLRPNPSRIAAAAGAAVFALLAAWTVGYLRNDLLYWGLGAYLLFAVIHAGFSVWPHREEVKTPVGDWASYVPLLALGLLFLCVWRGETSFAVWVVVLLVNLIAIGIAWSSRSVVALVIALIVTLVTAGLWILTAPPLDESIVGILIVVGGFGVFFATAATFLSRTFGFAPNDARSHVPAIAAAMPFVLLLMAIAKLPIGAPTAVFSVALLLAIVLLGLGIVARTSWIAVVALAFTWAVEREWHSLHYLNSYAVIALGWYTVFMLVYIAYPFFSNEERSAIPWAVGALSGAFHFWLIYELVSTTYPHLRNGLLPALFILPFAFGVYFLIKRRGLAPAPGDARLAWQGGAALFFLSLVFPIQFEREWITLGWALEGLALLVLFRFVPHPGLRLVGAALLCVAFVRLALNPAVLDYHPRARTRIWNWYLYAYGLTTVCLFAGARAVQQYRETLLGRVVPRLLYTLGTILAFILLNIEIADYFSVGPTLTLSLTGNFARDMTYSIAWALFAFVLLLVGMKRDLRYVRYAGMALLLITLAKLFLNDLVNLSPLYRIGAFIGVALILIVASFVYQRFLSPAVKKEGTPL